MKKKLLFTHGIDIDGYGCAILAKMVWGENVDVIFADNFDLDEKFIKVWGGKERNFDDYDEIFVTDHCIDLSTCNMVDKDKKLRAKIKVFDHHETRIGQQDRFPWVTLIFEKNGKRECGTSLFCNHLIERGLLPNTLSEKSWVELTRLYDTWDWKMFNVPEANKLNTLALALGRENYIENMLTNHADLEDFDFSDKEENLIAKYEKAFNEQLHKYGEQIRVIDFGGAKAGYVEIKDMFKNDMASYVRGTELGNQISYLIMPIKDRGTVSLRAVDQNFDVSSVATQYGGGGHPCSASFPLKNLPKIDKNSGINKN